ncbi:MAG: DUF362 domain-containing protein [Candidatus Aminicenantes bacterium]|nr:DUF362 domain-containing protein [Candidatus Aminicenantes bacterium]
MKNKLNRRDFLKKSTTSVLGAGLALKTGFSLTADMQEQSRVVEINHSGAVASGRLVNTQAVKEMLQRGLNSLTGTENPWSKFIKPTDTIGLKINTLGRPLLFTHHELIKAVSEDLIAYGVKENNIIVWDRHERHMQDCKFTFNTNKEGIRCYGTEALDTAQNRFDQEMSYKSDFDDPDKRGDGGNISQLSRIFTEECDKIINMAILKDHGYSGVTLCLKNLAYGVSDNNGRFHGPQHIGPFIADMCTHPLLKKKVVLHMIDGLEACFDMGPAPRNPKALFTPQTLWLGTDPVALDTVGFQVIDAERKERGLPVLAESGRPIDHIELAGKKGIGVSDLNRITVDRISLS